MYTLRSQRTPEKVNIKYKGVRWVNVETCNVHPSKPYAV